jgi:hypothetical protein
VKNSNWIFFGRILNSLAWVSIISVLLFQNKLFAAIALDNSNSTNGFGTAVSFSYTNTAGNFMVACLGFNGVTAATWSNVQYNGVALTSQIIENNAAGINNANMFTLKSPTTGANNFTATQSASQAWYLTVYTFTGVNDIELVAGNTNGGGTGTLSITTTTANANDWGIDCSMNGSANVITAGTGQANTQTKSQFGAEVFSSTKGPLSAGSNTMSQTASSFAQPAYALVAISPSGGVVVTAPNKSKKLINLGEL